MKPVWVLLAVMLGFASTFAAEQSCVGRCYTFDPQKKCQCDSMCVYYSSCCTDFDTACPKKTVRGDTFGFLEETTAATATTTAAVKTSMAPPPFSTTHIPTAPPDPDAVPCSERPFDAFLQLKNGSIYAFRGDYFFELDEKAILPGYPKLISDVWGISGPIDAAFTRINCQGKTYIFKGDMYWRFDGDVLDADYPRAISVGFENIPDDVNAAFAIAAPGHHGKEKVYFFKGDRYYQYEFKHQPSHEECVHMTRSSPSVLFTHYTDLYCDKTWEDLFTQLFGGSYQEHHSGPRLIRRDWGGIPSPVDAAMVGRIYISPKPTLPPSRAQVTPARRRAHRRRRPGRRRGQQARQSRSVFIDYTWSLDDWYADYSDIADDISAQQQVKSTPVQNVYFFKRDKYYRVDLQTKHVDIVNPPYPRSIAKFWLGCKHEESHAEKR